MICRLFIDEVGNGDLKGSATDDNARFLSLTGVLTKQSLHAHVFEPSLKDFKQDIFGTEAVILHRREIVRREGPFSILRDEALQDDFNTRLLLLLRELPYLVMTVTIDKREHLNQYGVWHFDPYHYCLRCLIERYVLWLRRHSLTGDVAIEPRHAKADKKVKESFRLIFDRGTEHIGKQTAQECLTSKEIKFFPKCRNIAGMQVCDLIEHPSYRHMKFKQFGLEIPDDFGTSIARILLERRYSRHPKTLEVSGYGVKWLPR